VRFEGFRGKYVFHCHNPEHEDTMMMSNFEVV
jgi:spore coat protein A, manganese oxidase